VPGCRLVELLFVNICLPHNSGLFSFINSFINGFRINTLKHKSYTELFSDSLTVIMIGYSSYAMIFIRSSAKPPMNQNDPSDIFSLSYYINMKQYGSSPKLFYGKYYSSRI
jgi:hypothetical protein